MGPRIVVHGPSGSGKTTLSRKLGEKLSLPVLELDTVIHAYPNWVDLSRDEFRQKVFEYLDTHPDGWVIDGNYTGFVQDIILPRAETAIWLKLPWRTVYPRLAWRTISRAVVGKELFNGNRESLKQTFLTRDSMLWWGIHAWRPHHERMGRALSGGGFTARVYRLRTPGQVRYLLENAVLAQCVLEN